MGWFDKIAENKTSVVLGIAATALAVGVGILYKNYSDQGEGGRQKVQQNTLETQIAKLKQQVASDPSLSSLKNVLKFSMEYARDAVSEYSKQFKKRRRSFDRQTRNKNFGKYLRVVLQGMNQIQQIGVRTQQQLMQKIGITQRDFAKYQNELGIYLQQQMMTLMQPKVIGKQLSISDVRLAVNKQTKYLEQNGHDLGTKIVNASADWAAQEKMLLPSLLSVVIADEVFGDEQQFDEDLLQAAEMKYQNQLGAEMMELQQAIQPLIMALSQNMGGMGMGGMDMMGGMGGMGGMDMMGGVTPQQLQQLQMQDPEAFAQLMSMMQR